RCSTPASSSASLSVTLHTIPALDLCAPVPRASIEAHHACAVHSSPRSSTLQLSGPPVVSGLSTPSACLSPEEPEAKADTPAQVWRNKALPAPSFPCLPKCSPASTALCPPCCIAGSGLLAKPASMLRPACRLAWCNKNTQFENRLPPALPALRANAGQPCPRA